jgi:signal transduction histidine kinase
MNHLKRKELLFCGKITAGITHEMKNVFAIIQESSGLLEDILDITENDIFPHKERFKKTLDGIHRQIQRGIHIATHLNRFAHSSDNCPTILDLNEITEHMVLLTSRFAWLKNVVLESSPSARPLVINSDPVSLEMAVFESIEILLKVIGSGGKIMLSPRKIENEYILGIGCENTDLTEEDFLSKISSTEGWVSLQEVMAYLCGAAKVFGPTLEILLSFPKSIPV